jgi:peptidoglycan/xylan/chitin deacetylase (PgdA/CDA1 family)
MFYFVRTPWWLKKVYGQCIWNLSPAKKNIYLSFDDGPHPTATNFVLNELDKYNAKATFFCIGKNVAAHENVYQKIIDSGHSIGNHTYNHLNGWKTQNDLYLENILQAKKYIHSNLFRPPYGRIKKSQVKLLRTFNSDLRVIMWSVLSGDFDAGISSEKCFENVVHHAGSGSIIVFHDSEKAFKHLTYALPKVLEYYSKRGYMFEKITGV